MALTNLSQVTSSGIHTLSNYSTHNINSTGIITATEFSGNLSNSSGISTFAEIRVTGNLTVEGTTTTLDSNLTEVDRIEVGANSTNPGIAVTQSGTGAAAFFNGGDVNIATGNIALASATPMVVASNGSGHLRLGAGGSEKARITSVGTVGLSTASPGARLHIHAPNTDLSTIRLSGTAANQVEYDIRQGIVGVNNAGFSIRDITNSATRLVITSAGNVGINDSNPTAKLSVIGNLYVSSDSFTGENSGIFFSGWNDYGAGVYGRNSGNDLVMNAGSSEKVRVTSAGSVGIGVTNPDLKLHVNGVNALPSSSGSTPTGHLTLRAKASSSSHGMFMGVSNAAPWSSWIQAQDANNNATEYPLLLNPNGGNVGINTTTPRALVDFGPGTGNGTLNQTVANYQAVFEAPTGTGNYTRNIAFASRTSAISAAINAVDEGGSDATGLIVATGTAGAIAERLRITSAGKLTVTPADTTSSYATTDGGIDIAQTISSTGTSASQSIGIQFSLTKSGQTGAIAEIGAIREGSGLSGLVFRTRDNSTGRNERLRITSSGELISTNGTLRRNVSDSSFTVSGDTASNTGANINLYGASHGSLANVFRVRAGSTERLRIAGNGQVLIGNYATHSAIHGNLEVNGNDGINISNATRTGTNGVQWRLIPHNGGGSATNLRLYEGTGGTEVINITKDGKVGINETSPSYKLHVKETTSASNYVYVQNTTTGNAGVRFKNSQGDFLIFVSPDLRIYDYVNNRDRLRISNNGRIGINADPTTYANSDSALGLLVKNGHSSSDHTFLDIQNGSSESGRIRFVDGDNGIAGQIYFSHNTARGGVSGNCMGFFTGNNALRFQVTTTGAKVHGSTDGVLELDTTDTRGSFIRFQENESTKVWAGCSEGIGTGGDQDDFGIRATGGFRLRTGSNNSIEVNDEGQIKLRPLTAGFTTLGATNTYPGAAVSIQCHGVGAGTGTNIPQYGLYVDGAHSSNDATLMTGVFSVAKQNTEGSAIGVHGLYYRDWSSYTKKIGGLFQAPCRSPRNATRSFNPGGGMFANTTSTGFANRLASGGPQPNGTTPASATYGDNTALWGDCFRSDTDTSSESSHNIAIKATNRVNHGHSRVGLMVGTVDGNDTSHNRRRVQAVEYYTEDTYQRFYNRNHKKEMNHHEPLSMSSTDGSRSTMNNVWTANYYVQKYQGNNQYSWYYYNTHSSSYARNGRLKFYITWTTGHASGVGEAEYSVAYTVPHSGGTILMRRCTRFHQWSIGGSYYGWNHNPDVKFFHSTSTGNNAGIYLRLEGAQMSFDGYVIQSIELKAIESNYGFSTEPSFRWVSHSTPSDAASSAETNYAPSTS